MSRKARLGVCRPNPRGAELDIQRALLPSGLRQGSRPPMLALCAAGGPSSPLGKIVDTAIGAGREARELLKSA
jgi:hypothetical protein